MPTPESPLLELVGVSVSFDGFLALKNLNLQLAAGELRAVIGPNGAGKTTFLDVITGKVRPQAGDVYFRGRSLKGRNEHQIARLGVGRKFQSPRVFEQLSVQENLALAVSTPKTPMGLLWRHLTGAQRQRIRHLLEVINLAPRARHRAGSLSHGQKQWLEIGMLVVQAPRLLLVDEPVAGLSDAETERTADLLKSLAGDHTVLVIEHDMEFIRRLQTRVTVLHQGQVLCEGSMDQVQTDPRVVEVYLGAGQEEQQP
ncbi:urea ABC transporter ATP-binding protein UrtD [Candidatus Synechococcus spongiarum]|uniref:urea ABC transporter ATP-binding protein UrtD n=1 Tax=Candidatus Synechococcus spongiarum TaxID=431041 RepID=UPI000472D9E0|nr:urea ABC transporter ATP-binding protein UrtD [Candidatus Synechococcus spongiarum]